MLYCFVSCSAVYYGPPFPHTFISLCDPPAVKHLDGSIPQEGIRPILVKHALASSVNAHSLNHIDREAHRTQQPKKAPSIPHNPGVGVGSPPIPSLGSAPVVSRAAPYPLPILPSQEHTATTGQAVIFPMISVTIAPLPPHFDVLTLCEIFPNMGHIDTAYVKPVTVTNSMGYASVIWIGYMIAIGACSPIGPVSESFIVIEGQLAKVMIISIHISPCTCLHLPSSVFFSLVLLCL